MTELPVLGCALNLSEGRRPDVVEVAARQAASAAPVLDVSSDPDHNRTVLTLGGRPEEVVEGVVRAAGVMVDTVDLADHSGVHPRIGVVDVVPFYPLKTAAMADAVSAAVECGHRLWAEWAIPVFLYEEAAPPGADSSLPSIRRHAFTDRLPDLGGPGPHPTAGAAVVGARRLLVAYNVDLGTGDVAVARSVAATLRRRHVGNIRTLGLFLPSRGTTQVSMNILRPEVLTLGDAYRAVAEEAWKAGVRVTGSETIGLVPRACLAASDVAALQLRKPPNVLEDVVDELLG